jgi:hypothetical protein
MQIYRASLKRLLVIICAFGAVAALGSIRSSPESLFTFGFIGLCLLVFTVMFCARRPILTLNHGGVQFVSIWGKRFVDWREVNSIKSYNFGPFSYTNIETTHGDRLTIPQWFEPSSAQLGIELAKLRTSRLGSQAG